MFFIRRGTIIYYFSVGDCHNKDFFFSMKMTSRIIYCLHLRKDVVLGQTHNYLCLWRFIISTNYISTYIQLLHLMNINFIVISYRSNDNNNDILIEANIICFAKSGN